MKKQIIFKMFLEKYDKEHKLINYLTKNEIQTLKQFPSFSKELEIKKEALIDSVHYSWFIPFLNIYTPDEASLFLLVMKPSYKNALQNLLDLKEIKEDLNPLLKKFLKELLYTSLIKKEEPLLPIECLFVSKLNILLNLNKNKLIKLINFLSCYDLIKELKQVVEKKKLKKIYSYFNEDEKNFIKSIFNYVEPFTTQRLNLSNFWDDKKKVKNILHARGLMRLAFALSGESIDLIWYVCHYLDIGRGNYILKYCKKEKVKNISEIICSQILNIMNKEIL